MKTIKDFDSVAMKNEIQRKLLAKSPQYVRFGDDGRHPTQIGNIP